MASLPGLSSSWGYLNGVNPRLVTNCWQSCVNAWYSNVRDTSASHKNITAYQRYTNRSRNLPSCDVTLFHIIFITNKYSYCCQTQSWSEPIRALVTQALWLHNSSYECSHWSRPQLCLATWSFPIFHKARLWSWKHASVTNCNSFAFENWLQKSCHQQFCFDSNKKCRSATAWISRRKTYVYIYDAGTSDMCIYYGLLLLYFVQHQDSGQLTTFPQSNRTWQQITRCHNMWSDKGKNLVSDGHFCNMFCCFQT